MYFAGKFLRTLYFSLSASNRMFIRRIVYFPLDVWDTLLRRRAALTPPRGMIFVGSGDFAQVGDSLFSLIQDKCNIKPHHHVLDAGCGIGRLARPLASYLDEKGSYTGFDVVQQGIDWCKKYYRHLPNFRFEHIPLHNDLYNAGAAKRPESFVFPYPDNSFDLVIFTSVFTHLLPPATENYIAQSARVLRPGGYVFATAYLVNDEVANYYENALLKFFPKREGEAYLHSMSVQSANVGYRSDFFLGLFQKVGLEVQESLPGWWPGREKSSCANFQDIVVFQLRK